MNQQNVNGTVRAGHAIRPSAGPRRLQLKRALDPWQIFLLALSGIIGVTIFSTIGEVLNTAGTAGLILALTLVGVTAICVMECLSELIVLWPVPNALVEYVKKFVDEDLAIVVGIGYWYTWSSIFTGLLIPAHDFFCLFLPWELPRAIIFIAIAFLLWGINALGVRTYGIIESIGGAVKGLNALAGGCFLWAAVAKEKIKHNPGFGYRPWEANNSVVAFFISIPILAYGMIGVEIVAITAFEARDRESLREPSRWIAWIITFIYLFVAIPGSLAVPWSNSFLPKLEPKPADWPQKEVTKPIPDIKQGCQPYYPLIVVAAFQYGSKAAAYYFNACIVYFCISAANTALYVASRTLYGLMREEEPRDLYNLPLRQKILQSPRILGRVSPRSHVPQWALLASGLAFVWLVGLRASSSSLASETLDIVITIGSVGGVLVWAAQCLAYIKYYHWLAQWKHHLPDYYDRDAEPVLPFQKKRPFLSSGQPIIAYVGLTMCLLIVFVFSTATWWNGKATPEKVASAFAGPGFLFVVFVILKIRRWLLGRPASTLDPLRIHLALENLAALPVPLGNENIRDDIPMREDHRGNPSIPQHDAETAAAG